MRWRPIDEDVGGGSYESVPQLNRLELSVRRVKVSSPHPTVTSSLTNSGGRGSATPEHRPWPSCFFFLFSPRFPFISFFSFCGWHFQNVLTRSRFLFRHILTRSVLNGICFLPIFVWGPFDLQNEFFETFRIERKRAPCCFCFHIFQIFPSFNWCLFFSNWVEIGSHYKYRLSSSRKDRVGPIWYSRQHVKLFCCSSLVRNNVTIFTPYPLGCRILNCLPIDLKRRIKSRAHRK